MPLRSQRTRELPPTGPSTRGLAPATARSTDQVAKLYLEIAQLFVAYGKPHIARRRLKFVIDQCGDSTAAVESRTLLDSLDAEKSAAGSPSAATR